MYENCGVDRLARSPLTDSRVIKCRVDPSDPLVKGRDEEIEPAEEGGGGRKRELWWWEVAEDRSGGSRTNEVERCENCGVWRTDMVVWC